MPSPEEMLHLDAALAALTAHSSDLANVTARLQSNLPTYVETHHQEIPLTSTYSMKVHLIKPLAAQLVRVRGFLVTFPNTSVTLFRVTLGDLVFDVLNGGIVLSDMAMALFLRQTDTIQLDLQGIPNASTNTSYATVWVWGEQVPTTGMLS